MNEMLLTFVPVENAQVGDLRAWRRSVTENVTDHQCKITTSPLLAENECHRDKAIPTGEHLAVFALLNGVRVGCGSVYFHDESSSPDNASGRYACLMNIFVSPEYRRRGIGRQLVLWLVKHARAQGIAKIYLESSIEMKQFYRSAGFTDMGDMMIFNEVPQSIMETPEAFGYSDQDRS